MKLRKLKANLGRTYPSRNTAKRSKKYLVHGDAKAIHFRQLWARKESALSVSYGDVLDFALARQFGEGNSTFILGLCADGIWIRRKGEVCDRVISFKDLHSLVNGQTLLPT